MKTTEITVNAECPGCGDECPPKLGVPGEYQHGWVWDDATEQRWCQSCYETLEAGRHYEIRGWVWKVTHHDVHGDRVEYTDELTPHHESAEAYGSATVTLIYDPTRPVAEDVDFRYFSDQIAGDLSTTPDRVLMVSEDMADALREELDRD